MAALNGRPARRSRAMRPRRRDEEIARVEIDGELVLYDERDDSMHYLNPTATLVWKLCDGSGTIRELAEDVADVFGMPVSDAERDIRQTVRWLGDAALMDVPKPRTSLLEAGKASVGR